MEPFLKRHESRIKGIISGFDRILFRGTLRSISYSHGIERWLWYQGVLLRDFGAFAEKVSTGLKKHAQAIAEKQGRPFLYVESPKRIKQAIARKMMEKDHIAHGLICVLSCVEPCRAFKLEKNRRLKTLTLNPTLRQCLHLYFYFIDREFGLMHVRLQTWLPFTIQVCINGWEWLGRRLDGQGIQYEKRDNCFIHIDDIPKAQRLMHSLIERKWIRWLNRLAKRCNPWLDPHNGLELPGYYWSIREGEYATDVLFKNSESLKALYPTLLHHAIDHFRAKEVLRFLQRRFNSRSTGEVKSDLTVRVEGVRVKHWVDENSIKMYDKQGCVLRIETTINNPRRWNVRREVKRKGKRVFVWVALRKGVADLRRRAEISLAANRRYLEALAVVGEPLPAFQLLDPISKAIVRDGRPYRGLRPISPEDSKVFRTITQGEFLLHPFRNKDLRPILFPQSEKDPLNCRKSTARISRTLRLLRAHGLIAKISRTHCYRITPQGHAVMATSGQIRTYNVLGLAA